MPKAQVHSFSAMTETEQNERVLRLKQVAKARNESFSEIVLQGLLFYELHLEASKKQTTSTAVLQEVMQELKSANDMLNTLACTGQND
jgi:hypothetical protein